MTVLRLVPLTLGWQELDRCIALDGYPPGVGDRIPQSFGASRGPHVSSHSVALP